MNDLLRVKPSPRQLAAHDLPDADYWLRAPDIHLFKPDGELPISALLAGAQLRSSEDSAVWQELEPAMARLSEILAAGRAAPRMNAHGDGWSLVLGEVDLASTLVTIQRKDTLIAAITGEPDGGLKVTAYRPLDADSCRRLLGLGRTPAADGTVVMRPNNWEYALDCSVGMGNLYCAERGESYLSFWEFGLGVSHDGSGVPLWHAQRTSTGRLASLTYSELAAFCAD